MSKHKKIVILLSSIAMGLLLLVIIMSVIFHLASGSRYGYANKHISSVLSEKPAFRITEPLVSLDVDRLTIYKLKDKSVIDTSTSPFKACFKNCEFANKMFNRSDLPQGLHISYSGSDHPLATRWNNENTPMSCAAIYEGGIDGFFTKSTTICVESLDDGESLLYLREIHL